MPQIFISHASQDAAQSTRLHDWLRAQGFHATFLDFDTSSGIAAGASWEKTLYRELSACDAVLLILTANWFASKWCFVEFAQARALGKTIIPLIETPTGETLVSSDIQHLDLVLDRNGGLERLRAELTRISLNTRGGFPWDAARSPFPGLLAFDQPDAAIYFGRDDEIRRLIERLNARRAQGVEKLVAVLGASGAGKSSLLRAGVLPRLARDPRNWIILPPFRPQLHPIEELAQSIANALHQPADWKTWRAALSAPDPGELHETLSDLSRDLRATHDANEAHILLSIDQAEELFTADALTTPDSRTSAFFRVLNALLDDRLPFLAVLTLRSDYLGRLQAEPRLTAPFEQFSLKPMPFERVREIILGPARVAGLAVDDALVTAAMADARTEDALPLLAFTLRELYDRAAGTARLTLEAYSALGDPQAQLSPLENAVRRKADEVLAAAKPTPEALDALKQAFIPSLVRIDAQGDYVRRAAPLAAIPPLAIPLMERLSKARLLTILDENGVTTVEVAHEALLRKWPLLRGWLDDEREFLIGRDRLAQDVADWQRVPAEMKPLTLLTGLRLAVARTWLEEKSQQLTSADRGFIEQSIAHLSEQEALQERIREEAKLFEKQAMSRQLALKSITEASSDLGAAMGDAVAAGDFAHTLEAVLALNMAVNNPWLMAIVHHPAGLNFATYSSDSNKMVTASKDGIARIWDTATGRLQRRLIGHTDAIWRAIFTDPARIVTSSADKTVRIWSADTAQLLATHVVPANNEARLMLFSDGLTYLTMEKDGRACLWNSFTGEIISVLVGHTDKVAGAAFAADRRKLITSGYDNTARVWSIPDGRLLITLTGHTREVYSPSFSLNGSRVLTASGDGTARIWDANTGELIASVCGKREIYHAIFFNEARQVITAGYGDPEARIWDATSGELLRTLSGHTGDIESIGISSDGRRVVTASTDRTARVWDPFTGQVVAVLAGHTAPPYPAAFLPDGRTILTASPDGSARIWNPDGASRPIRRFSHPEAVVSTRFSPDGLCIVTASRDGFARIWSSITGELLNTLAGHKQAVNSATWSPDGATIITAGSDQTLRVWNAMDGCLLHTLRGHYDNVVAALFSPDGSQILSAAKDNTLRVWDVGTMTLICTILVRSGVYRGHFPDFSPDGKRVVFPTWPNIAQVWDLSTAQVILTLTGHTSDVNSAVFSKDGTKILTSSSDGSAGIHDAQTGERSLTISAGRGWLRSAAFSPDSRTVVTSGWEGAIRLWDAASGRPLGVIPTGSSSGIDTVSFSSDGTRVVISGQDRTAKIIPVDFPGLREWARQSLPRETSDETKPVPQSEDGTAQTLSHPPPPMPMTPSFTPDK